MSKAPRRSFLKLGAETPPRLQIQLQAELRSSRLPRVGHPRRPQFDVFHRTQLPPHLASGRVHAHRPAQPGSSSLPPQLPGLADVSAPQDKSFTLTLFAHQSTFDSLDAQLAKGGDMNPVVKLFRDEFPDALELMSEEELLKSWRENPKDGLITVEVRFRCGPCA